MLKVYETDVNFCKGDTAELNITLTTPVGLLDISKIEGVNVYPNPVTSYIFIDTELNVDYLITDVSGRNLYAGKASAGDKHKVNVDHLSTGVYYIKLSSENKTATSSFIKQ